MKKQYVISAILEEMGKGIYTPGDEFESVRSLAKKYNVSHMTAYNVIGDLEEKGLMTKAGRDSIEIAKENGSWTILDSIEAMIIPEDLEHEFQKSSGSMDYFLTLSKTIKKGILYWVKSAKRPETRSKRIKEVAEKISMQTVPKQFK